MIESYNITGVMSEGSSTVTFKAKELFNDDLVAIKSLRVDNLYAKTDAFEKVQKIKKINHRNIISILGKANPNENPKYVISEYIEGTDLLTLITENGLKPIWEVQRCRLFVPTYLTGKFICTLSTSPRCFPG